MNPWRLSSWLMTGHLKCLCCHIITRDHTELSCWESFEDSSEDICVPEIMVTFWNCLRSLGIFCAVIAQVSGINITFYIGIQEENWNYAPSGQNLINGKPIAADEWDLYIFFINYKLFIWLKHGNIVNLYIILCLFILHLPK